MDKVIKSVPIYINFSISKNSEIDIILEENEELTDGVAKREFLRSHLYQHLKTLLKAGGFIIDDMEVIL